MAEQLDAIQLAVSEAATNIGVHAYDGHPGEITVDARLASGELSIRVADDGLGMRPNIDSPGLGVGLALNAALSPGPPSLLDHARVRFPASCQSPS